MNPTSEHIAEGEAPHHPTGAGQDAAAAVFSAADWAGFRSDDYNAGKAVVVLVLSIFLMGVGIYSIVAYTVMNWN